MRACAIGLLAGALLSPGLGCTSSFQCESAEDCKGNEEPGTCEPNGYCSFPDELCASGRRYGAHAGDGLGGTCVPRDTVAEGSGSAGGVTSMAPATSSSGATAGPSTSAVDATTAGPASTGTGPALTGGATTTETTSGGQQGGCTADEFDEIGAQWNPFSTTAVLPTVVAGEVVYDIGLFGGFMGLHGVTVTDYTESRLVLEVTQVFSGDAQLELGLTNENNDEWIYTFVRSGQIGLTHRTPDFDTVLAEVEAPAFTDRLHLILEVEDGQMRSGFAADAGAETSLTSHPAPAFLSSAIPQLDAAAFEPGLFGEAHVDRYVECLPPGM